MNENTKFDYYYGIEADRFSFYRVPRLLIKDERFKGLSSDAKLLYGLMLDRMSLSMKNGWLDEENRAYIIYTVDAIMEDLGCAKATCVKIMKELDSEKGIGLIEKKRRGLGKPDIIYVKNFATMSAEQEVKEPENTGKSTEVQNLNFKKSNIDTSRSSEIELQEVQNLNHQKYKLINYFDPSVRFELVLFNRQVNEQMLTEQFDIPWQEDDFNDIREEYTEMLKKQAAKGNNGIIKSKYLIFGVESNGYKEAKSRLNNIEKDVIRNFRRKPRKWNRQIWKQSRQNLERTIWMWLQISGQRQKNCFIVWTDRVQMILKRRYMRMCSRR